MILKRAVSILLIWGLLSAPGFLQRHPVWAGESRDPLGRALSRAELFSGQILLGEIEFLDGLPATADVVLIKDADYIALDNEALNRIMADHPRIGYTVVREIARIEARRLRKTSTK